MSLLGDIDDAEVEFRLKHYDKAAFQFAQAAAVARKAGRTALARELEEKSAEAQHMTHVVRKNPGRRRRKNVADGEGRARLRAHLEHRAELNEYVAGGAFCLPFTPDQSADFSKLIRKYKFDPEFSEALAMYAMKPAHTRSRKRNPHAFPAEDRALISRALKDAGCASPGLWATKLQKEGLDPGEVEFKLQAGGLERYGVPCAGPRRNPSKGKAVNVPGLGVVAYVQGDPKTHVVASLTKAGAKYWDHDLSQREVREPLNEIADKYDHHLDVVYKGRHVRRLYPRPFRENPKRKPRRNNGARYASLHGGLAHEMRHTRGSITTEAPSCKGPFVLLGRLSEICYDTAKGGDGPSRYEHEFGRPFPLLVVNGEGELMIVRGLSHYKVEPRGIVG